MKINELDTVAIVGLGLLGGSVGMAINRTFTHIRRVGYSHRPSTRRKAMEVGVVDEVYAKLADTVREAQLVILASPIGTFPQLMEEMAGALNNDCIVTDVGSTKVLPSRWARQALPRRVEFLGSHPMAGSEQRGVEFARADLFEAAHCIITPTAANKNATVTLLTQFWESLGMRVCRMTPARHDRVLASISHLPHALAAALVNSCDPAQTLLCGKGFLDTTRIASGPTNVWGDILMSNAANTGAAVGRLIRELTRIQKALQAGDEKKVTAILDSARQKRDKLVQKKLQRRELPQ